MDKRKVLIIGAAGRDFHNFNTFFRKNAAYEVVAFTAAQIPKIDDRTYPAVLAGELYPAGIPIFPEPELERLIEGKKVDVCVMAYSDLPYPYVMHMGARVNAAGADFWMQGTKDTMIKSTKPLIAITAVRTGCGKSQVSRFVAARLRAAGKKVVSIRHPMPYGDLAAQAVQRMATLEDIDNYKCTIEEREEYEMHVQEGGIIYAGVDYEAILRQAEKEADIVIWDGGNNDWPFYKPDLWMTVADPLRPGHESAYYPGEVNVRGCDVVVIGKTNVASKDAVSAVEESCRKLNPKAKIVRALSVLTVDHPEVIKGKRILAVEDGPTLTHGEMTFGAATQAARENGATAIVDPRKWAVGGLAETYAKYPRIGDLLPAMGYYPEQVADLENTINAVDCDAVVIGTPFNIKRLVNIKKPSAVVTYAHQDADETNGIGKLVDEFVAKHS
ncbi:MAG: cyclic 2,3-diphosphoglycerate synthase [Myxococcota bacterium]|jgi:predicted GTPase|nr:cyclic 2,3-diphosphoglycerate synthase [Myxococcota bacterium]